MNTQNQQTEPTTIDRINKVIAEQLGIPVADIKSDKNMVEDFGADSLDAVELVMALEDEFEREIPDEHAEQWKIVQDIYNYFK